MIKIYAPLSHSVTHAGRPAYDSLTGAIIYYGL